MHLESLEWRWGWVCLRKDPSALLKVCTINPYLSLPQDDFWPFTRVTVCWGKWNNQTFRELLPIGSELTLIPENPKGHCDPPVREVAYDPWNFSSGLSHSGPSVGPESPQFQMHKLEEIHWAAGRLPTLNLWLVEWGLLWCDRPSRNY